MKLTPFEPGTLRLAGKNKSYWIDTENGGRRNIMLPLTRRQELVWYWIERPIARFLALFRDRQN